MNSAGMMSRYIAQYLAFGSGMLARRGPPPKKIRPLEEIQADVVRLRRLEVEAKQRLAETRSRLAAMQNRHI